MAPPQAVATGLPHSSLILERIAQGRQSRVAELAGQRKLLRTAGIALHGVGNRRIATQYYCSALVVNGT
jgi:hypothetical protein